MKKDIEAFGSMINIHQILIGLTVLLLGSLVYLVDRPPDQIYFLYKSSVNISLHNILPNLFGSIGNSLPSFMHVFSFILITASLISCRKKGCLIICLGWFLVDCAFELGQKFNSLFPKIIPDWFAKFPFLENTGKYFVHGTFDYFDLAAIAMGTVIAFFVLLFTNKGERKVMP